MGSVFARLWRARAGQIFVTGSAATGGYHPEISVPFEQAWELYHNSFSLCSKKLRVCLDELNLPYRSHPIDLIETGSYQNVSREFLAINPAGTVPVLIHEGHPIYESHDQIVYAARHTRPLGERLLPEDPEHRRVVDAWVDKASLVGDPMRGRAERAGHCVPGLTFPLFATTVSRIPISEILKGLLRHPNKERPVAFLLLRLLGIDNFWRVPLFHAAVAESRDAMKAHLDALSAQLEGHGDSWIAGEEFTLADVSWVVILDRLVEADWAGLFWGEDRRPAVAAYWERLRARPSYATAIDEARATDILEGIEDLRAAKLGSPALREILEGT